VVGSRLEDAEVFKVGKHGEQDLTAHRGDLYFGQHQTQLLYRARPAGAAVANEASRLVVPLVEQKINRVFERAAGEKFCEILRKTSAGAAPAKASREGLSEC
jgi:hypothetical protein